MHIKEGFLLKKIAGEYTAIPYDASYAEVGAMVSLNDTGAFLWHLLETDTTEDALIRAVEEEYTVESAIAKEAVVSFLAMLEENQLLVHP